MPRRSGQFMTSHSGDGRRNRRSGKRSHQTQGTRKNPHTLGPWASAPTPAAQGIAAAEHADRLTKLMKR